MKTKLFWLIFVQVLSITILLSQKDQIVPFKEAKNYFVKNSFNKNSLKGNKVLTLDNFNKIFGMATVMGVEGKPTKIDFKKKFVITYIQEITNVNTRLIPVKLEKNGKKSLNFSFETKFSEKLTSNVQPFIMVIVDRKYKDYKIELSTFSISPPSEFDNNNQSNNTESKGLPIANQWILESFNNKDLAKISKSSYIMINSDLKSFSGKGGCNLINGELRIDGNSIFFEKVIMTKMACEEMAQESLFVKNLSESNKFKIEGGELFLYRNNVLLMTLESFR